MQHGLALCHLDMQWKDWNNLPNNLRAAYADRDGRLKSFIGLRLTSLDSIRRADTDVHE